MKARKAFERIGYEVAFEEGDTEGFYGIAYQKTEGFCVTEIYFDHVNKEIHIGSKINDEFRLISCLPFKVIKVINKQCNELGW